MDDRDHQIISDVFGTVSLIEGETFTIDDVLTAMRLAREQERKALLTDDQVIWVVNDNAELGVKIGDQLFFLYKGESLVYATGEHDNGTPMHWRTVGKREFGECCHPINYANPTMIGTVSLDDCDRWQIMPQFKGKADAAG